MEASVETKAHKQQEFALASISELASPSSSSSPIVARFSADCGTPELRFHLESQSIPVVNVDLRAAQVSFLLYSDSFIHFFTLFGCRESEGNLNREKKLEGRGSFRILRLRRTCLVRS